MKQKHQKRRVAETRARWALTPVLEGAGEAGKKVKKETCSAADTEWEGFRARGSA